VDELVASIRSCDFNSLIPGIDRLAMPRVATIDGPAGAGKSSVARRLAGKLDWQFLDTGAMYRVVTLAALRSESDLRSDQVLGRLAADLEVSWVASQVFLGPEDVTAAIRSVEVTRASRFVADSPSVRKLLVQWQRSIASRADTVTEGRDQGTIVFPDAFRKFFLTAAAEERAWRRLGDLQASGQPTSFESVLEDLRVRDARDLTRSIAPLKPADDAVVIDTSGLSIDQVVELLAAHITESIN
jgi:cytidylate kinase